MCGTLHTLTNILSSTRKSDGGDGGGGGGYKTLQLNNPVQVHYTCETIYLDFFFICCCLV